MIGRIWWRSAANGLVGRATGRPLVSSHAAKTGTDEDLARFQDALQRSYREFARCYPWWVQRGFDDRLLRSEPRLLCSWCASPGAGAAVTGMDLARRWERDFGVLLTGADRVQQVAELAQAASQLLAWLGAERRKHASR